MLITQRTAQLGVIEQKPRDINLASHPYSALIVGDVYRGGLSLLSATKVRIVKDVSVNDGGYIGSINVKSISKRGVVSRLDVYTKDAYCGGLILDSIQKKTIVVDVLVDDNSSYAGVLTPMSLSTKVAVVENRVDSKEAYSGIVKVTQLVKEEV